MFETSETLTLTLSSPVGATLARDTATGTIVNDDAGSCGVAAPHPASYTSVVVFAFENRSWNDVGLGFGTGMPYLHALGQKCSYFTNWTETDTNQNSLTQYTGQVTGARQAGNGRRLSIRRRRAAPKPNNIFRQARNVGKTAINYVEGATAACSASGTLRSTFPISTCGAPTTGRIAPPRFDR